MANVGTLVTPREFARWCGYFRWVDVRTTKLDYYLAQIAAEIRRSYAKNPRKVKLDWFMLELDADKEKKSKTVKTAPSKSKQIWMAALAPKRKGENARRSR